MDFKLILASGSKAREMLLQRLGIAFEIQIPNIDETRIAGENFLEYVTQMGVQKASVIAMHNPNAWVIGSDQICVCEQQIFGKPHCFENALRQLLFFSGKEVMFHTSICLINESRHQMFIDVIPYQVKFKHLTEQKIIQYLKKEDVLQCAGAFKAEALGISLFESMSGNDPTSLQGLPLIRTCDFLEFAKLI